MIRLTVVFLRHWQKRRTTIRIAEHRKNRVLYRRNEKWKVFEHSLFLYYVIFIINILGVFSVGPNKGQNEKEEEMNECHSW